jgi:hypothetical protein
LLAPTFGSRANSSGGNISHVLEHHARAAERQPRNAPGSERPPLDRRRDDGPLPAVSISLAEPDARDATPRGQDICEAIIEQLVLLRFKDTRS